jgi:nucleotide-binding universal stress UspA family protein
MRKTDRAKQDQTGGVQGAAESLSSLEARRAEDEARERAGHATSGEVMAPRRQRLEAETKRVSDEVTRQAQERLRRSAVRRAANRAPVGAERPEDASQGARPQPAERKLPPPLSLQRLLVPLDGTAYAERALPYAASLASVTGASIMLAHVRVPSASPPAARLGGLIAGVGGDKAGIDVADFPTYLHWLREWLKPYGQDVAIELVDAPSALEGLLKLEERGLANLVVLATHARQGAERLLLGSVADGLVRTGHAPVLVVPPLANVPTQSLPSLTRILVPLDGSGLAEQAMGPVLGLIERASQRTEASTAETSGALQEVMLLCVAESSGTRRHAERYLQRIRQLTAGEATEMAVSIHARAIVGSAPGAVVSAADQGLLNLSGELVPSDLIVMATHGRSGLRRWLYGSVAGYVVARAHVPVLLVRPATDEA